VGVRDEDRVREVRGQVPLAGWGLRVLTEERVDQNRGAGG